ncbi:class I SAM-dependent methyltransferase, partial [Shewanella sp. C32]
PALRALAEQAAARAPVPISVLDGTAEDLPAPDGSFDTAVSTLVLCSVRDLAAALGEIRRVLRPDGHFCFLEHLRAESAGFA